MTFLAPILFLAAYFGLATWVRPRLPFFLRGHTWVVAYVLFWVLNIVSFQLSLWNPLCLLLLVLPLLGLFLSRKGWGPLLALSFIAVVLTPIPISETDSVGYVLPMADNAITYQTTTTWNTYNFRSTQRFWGHAAQIGNILQINGRNPHGTQVVSLLGIFVLAQVIYLALRKQRSKHAKGFTWILILNPLTLAACFTLKDDLLLALFGIYLLLFSAHWQRYRLYSIALHICMITSKLFFPVYYVVLLLQRRRTWIPLALLAYLLIILFHLTREIPVILSYPTQLRAWVAAGIGAAPYELGVHPPFSPVPENSIASSYVAANPTIGHFLQQIVSQPFTDNSLFGHNWWLTSRYFYGYVDMGLPLLILGLCGLLTWNSTARQGWLLLILLTLCLSVPLLNHLRYYFGPLLIFAILGTRVIPKIGRRLLYFSLPVFILPLLYHPAFIKPWQYYQTSGRMAAPADTYTWNPVLYLSNPSLKSSSIFEGSVTWVPCYPGFSAQYLFTSNANTPCFEVFPTQIVTELSNNSTEFVIFSGLWNINVANLDVHLYEDIMRPLKYQLVGTLLQGQVLVFQKNAKVNHTNTVFQRRGSVTTNLTLPAP